MNPAQPRPEPGDQHSSRPLAPATLAVAAGRPAAEPGAPVNVPVVLTSTYVGVPGSPAGPDGFGPVYGRWSNETWVAFEDALGALEGGRALLFGSGMAAISATLALVPLGGHVVLPNHPYSGTTALLADLSAAGHVSAQAVDIADTEAVVAAMDAVPTAMLWVETPTNPMLEVADLPALVEAAHARGAIVAVDNTFATPLGLRPLELGADVVVHSVTKYLAGHSDVVLGATVVRDDALLGRLTAHRTLHGAIPGPFEAFLALRGLRTLALRVERACANAAVLAARLAEHPAVQRVRHPSLPTDPGHLRAAAHLDHFGAIIGVEVRGGAQAAEALACGVELWLHATSLGGVESSLERRRRHAAEAPTVPENLLRLSVGIEDVEDLWADLAQALDRLDGDQSLSVAARLLRTEGAALMPLLRATAVDRFDRPTALPGWSVRDVLAHCSAALTRASTGDLHSFSPADNQVDVDARSGWPMGHVLDELAGAYAAAASAIAAAGGRLDRLALGEWVHGGDVREALELQDPYASAGIDDALALLRTLSPDRGLPETRVKLTWPGADPATEFVLGRASERPPATLETDPATLIRLCAGRNPDPARFSLSGAEAREYLMFS